MKTIIAKHHEDNMDNKPRFIFEVTYYELMDSDNTLIDWKIYKNNDIFWEHCNYEYLKDEINYDKLWMNQKDRYKIKEENVGSIIEIYEQEPK